MKGSIAVSDKNLEYLIKEACLEACEREMSVLPTEADDPRIKHITFSKGFENNMDRLIADIRSGRFNRVYVKNSEASIAKCSGAGRKRHCHLHNHRKLKLIAIAAAMLLVLCACAATYIAIEMYIHPEEDHTDITFGTGSLSAGADAEQRFQVLKPDIPEGYEIIAEEKWADGQYYMCMANSREDEIIYRQSLPDSSGIAINTEHSGYTETEIGGFRAVRYESPGLISFIWTDDRYVYKVSGSCDEDLLVEVAESVNKKH